jgi:hypothetical protein
VGGVFGAGVKPGDRVKPMLALFPRASIRRNARRLPTPQVSGSESAPAKSIQVRIALLKSMSKLLDRFIDHDAHFAVEANLGFGPL